MSETRTAVRLICCGRDDGLQVCRTPKEAEELRAAYTSGPAVAPTDEPWKGGHQRAAILVDAPDGFPLGHHGPGTHPWSPDNVTGEVAVNQPPRTATEESHA